MNFVKVTTSGQVTIPKPFRDQFDTNYYVCEMSERGVLFRPVEIRGIINNKEYTIKDLTCWSFKSKNPREKNITKKIDQIVYKN